MSTSAERPGSPGSRLRPPVALAVYASASVAFMVAASAPTPLYRLYQQAWGFSSTVLTVVFSAYALVLLLTLLVLGRLSDYIGRRPLILLALGLQSVAMGLFLVAGDAEGLLAARMVQGAATGAATAALGAALLDLGQERGALINGLAPMVGMGLGAIGSTALVALAPAPLRTVFALLLAIFLALFALVWRAPETVARRAGAMASLRPRISVPRQVRAALLSVTPANTAVWMLGGLYLSLMPSLVASVMRTDSPWLAGFVVAGLTLSGAAGGLVVRGWATFSILLAGELALGAGLLAVLFGINMGAGTALLLGSICAGFGFGTTFLGAVRSIMPLALPNERGALMGAFYLQSYLSNSVPTMAAGYLAQRVGVLPAANIYGAVILVLVLLSLALLWRRRSRRQGHPEAC
ncbi:MFS transporter [Bordetella trematum]|uniref:MFS transporter n=1 Tax=Bordetella trematum TaxID=123899 RepID=UPI00398910A4